MKQYLRSYVNYQQDDWVCWLPMAEFAYNNSKNASTGVSPFFAAYDHHLWINDEIIDSQIKVPKAHDWAEAMLQLQSHLKGSWSAIVKTAAHNLNKNWKNIALKVGNWVWLSGRNIKTKRPSKKLDYKYHEPFKILAAVGLRSYWLSLPLSMKGVHPVFHASLLEKAEKSNNLNPSSILVKDKEHWKVEKILNIYNK